MSRGKLNWGWGDQGSSVGFTTNFLWTLVWKLLLADFPTIMPLFPSLPPIFLRYGWSCASGEDWESLIKLIVIILLALLRECFRNKSITQCWPMRCKSTSSDRILGKLSYERARGKDAPSHPPPCSLRTLSEDVLPWTSCNQVRTEQATHWG